MSPSPSSSDYNTSNDDSLLDALLRPEVIGGVAGVAMLAAAAFFIVVIVCLKRRKRKKTYMDSTMLHLTLCTYHILKGRSSIAFPLLLEQEVIVLP